ncbi:NAD+ synthase (glutamine-hydrolysing) [Variovorax beijingensis]|uniref:Glutamine-dependent NAD(+) synthetase n=2 Tax=Variovorax TaxID=34072 RepID=A0AAE4C0I5_VARPD|nr:MULTISPECIES: NAD+ synthase [Variovorax]MDP9968692.1 NAD+ synthase (glutamine-hydrolyzing) [Variovorax paradoxus]MDR6430188.1 NAD+ synthase (glutamine-hydrolyzing) [Variovorax paradoxus]MDR6456851.1 NAD+ synthase (glutamine-hydrolyzing) [Variovorax paradoxus]TWD73516.1 NAD+ synthase (glutamine-hydrolysing) [Variovorax beijingensis]
MLRITVAQLNPTIGDLAGNAARMIEAARQAAAAQADLVVFSELSLTAYYPADLLEEEGFMERVDDAFGQLLSASREMPALHWAVGLPARREGAGKKLRNVLRVICAGEVRLEYAKQLLPTYNVFDERRHFEPGPDVARVLRIRDTRVGFLICEDGWNDEGEDYLVNPFDRMRDAAPDLVVSINASPSNIGKREQRHRIFGAASRRNGLPILYVNQMGGHDQLVYDGASFAVEPQAGVVYEARRFAQDVCTLRFGDGRFLTPAGEAPPRVPPQGLPTLEFYRQQIVVGLRDYARRCGFRQAVVGSSGGIDSALTLALAVEALGAQNVVAVTMPSRFSSAGSVDDSETLCRNLGVPLKAHAIADIVAQFERGFEAAFGQGLEGVALENLQARVRGTILMGHSNSFGHLLLTTGNKSEISVGYCTLYGDTNGGLGLIGDLYKTEVFALSRHLNAQAGRELIPQAILDKEPSAELAPGQKDADSLPPYEVLDEILKLLIEGRRLAGDEYEQARTFVDRLRATPEGAALVERIRGMVARNEYKRRQSPPIVRVRPRAFGSGRQMPIAARWN